MSGMGSNRAGSARISAAAVGVTVSPRKSVPVVVAPVSNASVAGAGLGRMPCAVWTVPVPSGSGALYTSVTPSAWRAAATPTTSTTVSWPPSSCRCTESGSVPCSPASASAIDRSVRTARSAAGPALPANSISSAACRVVAVSVTCTVTRVAIRPLADTRSVVSSHPVRPVAAIAARISCTGAPASIRPARNMSPARPVAGLSQQIISPSGVRPAPRRSPSLC